MSRAVSQGRGGKREWMKQEKNLKTKMEMMMANLWTAIKITNKKIKKLKTLMKNYLKCYKIYKAKFYPKASFNKRDNQNQAFRLTKVKAKIKQFGSK